MTEDRGLLGGEILHRLQAQAYAGGKSSVYVLIRRLRPVTPGPVVRFAGLAGELSLNDIGQVEGPDAAEMTERIRFFTSRLNGPLALGRPAASQEAWRELRAQVLARAR